MITTPEGLEARLLMLLTDDNPDLVVVGEDGGIVVADRESKVRFRVVAQEEVDGCHGRKSNQRWF